MNLQNPLGLKTISWDSQQKRFISPARPDFSWDREGICTAVCTRIPSHDAPVEECTCGIYATFDWEIAKNYDRRYMNVMLLVEPGLRTIFHEYGFRSKQLRFVAAILQNEQLADLAAHQAADFYQIPVLSKEVALTIMDMENIHLLEWYIPVLVNKEEGIKVWRMRNEIATKAS